MPRLALVLATVLATGVALAGCEKEQVHIGFRPAAGANYRYEIKVQSVTTTRLGDDSPQRSEDSVVLESNDTVLDAAPEQVRVRVVLRRAGIPDRTFVVRFDRGAQLAGVDAVDGLPPDVLGSVGLPEFLPAAATAPPDRPLSTGERWKIDAQPKLGAGQPARLQGSGQLVKVSGSGARKVASIKAETRLPLSSTRTIGDSTVTISGTETTESTAHRNLADGAVQDATAVTKGTFRLTLTPTAGGTADPVVGTLTVEIRSQTRRL